MVKTKPVDVCIQEAPASPTEDEEFKYEVELNERIVNRRRRNAVTPDMAEEIRKMVANIASC